MSAPRGVEDARDGGRAADVRRALALEYLTVGWNVAEAAVALTAAALAGSVALLGFGVDSVIESASGAVLVWRLGAEAAARDAEAVRRLDARAHRLVGVSLAALAAYVAWEASGALLAREAPGASPLGITLTLVSMAVMAWLARAKRTLARRLDSRALAGDAFQTDACWWLSLLTLLGVGLNTAFGWWWADPLAALAFTPLLAREARRAWRGEPCGCHGGACAADGATPRR